MIWRKFLLPLLIPSLVAGSGFAQEKAEGLATSVSALDPRHDAAADKIHGFDLDTLAQATAKSTAFSSQFGAARWETSFDTWLRERGLTLEDYDAAYEGYLEKFEADTTGQLEESYFSALDHYTTGPQGLDLEDRTSPSLAAEDSTERFNEAYRANAWANLEDSSQTQGSDQVERVRQMLADSQALTNPAFLAMQDESLQKYAVQIEKFRKGALPGPLPEEKSAFEPELPPEPNAPLPPAEPSTIGTLHAELLSPLAARRHAAARPFAWECDALGLIAAAERASDPRSPFCQPEALRREWLPVALETLEQAPQDELHLVELLLPYLKILGFEAEGRPVVEALRQRLQEALPGSAARLALATGPERILLQSRDGDLRSALAAAERALAP